MTTHITTGKMDMFGEHEPLCGASGAAGTTNYIVSVAQYNWWVEDDEPNSAEELHVFCEDCESKVALVNLANTDLEGDGGHRQWDDSLINTINTLPSYGGPTDMFMSTESFNRLRKDLG